MKREEKLYTDDIYIGMRVISDSDFEKEFPDWYDNWKRSYSEKALNDYVLIPDYSYGISATLNAIYSVNFEMATASFLCSFKNEKNEGHIYHPPVRIGNTLLFAPCNARQWAYYNLNMNTWSYEDIPTEFIQGKGAFVKLGIIVGNMLIFMPGKTNVLISVDVKNGKISYHDCLKEFLQKKGDLFEFSSMISYRDSVLLFTNTGDDVYEIDTKTMRLINTHKIPMNAEGIQTAITMPETDWIFLLEHTMTSKIIKWDISSGATEVIKDLPIHSDENSVLGPIQGFCYDYSGLYIIPQHDNCIVKIDYHDNKVIRINLSMEMNLLERKDEFYDRWRYGTLFVVFAYNGYKNTYTMFLPYDFSIAEIDFDKGIFHNRRKWRVDGIENLRRQSMKQQVDGIYMENVYFDLKEFVYDLTNK